MVRQAIEERGRQLLVAGEDGPEFQVAAQPVQQSATGHRGDNRPDRRDSLAERSSVRGIVYLIRTTSAAPGASELFVTYTFL